MSAASATVAEQLRRAYAEGPIAPVRTSLASPTADLAYEIQEINTRHWSAAGPAHRRPQDRADVARRAEATRRLPARLRGAVRRHGGADGGEVDAAATDPAPGRRPRSPSCSDATCRLRTSTSVDVMRAIDFVLPAIEIVDSRIAGLGHLASWTRSPTTRPAAMYRARHRAGPAVRRGPATVRHGAGAPGRAGRRSAPARRAWAAR